MKRFIFPLFILGFFAITSCTETPIEVPQDIQKTETTVKIQEQAEKDTVVYKAISVGSTLYLVNPKTKLVEKKISNDSWLVSGLPYWVLICIILIILALAGFFSRY